MEDALVRQYNELSFVQHVVLILVVMEDALVQGVLETTANHT